MLRKENGCLKFLDLLNNVFVFDLNKKIKSAQSLKNKSLTDIIESEYSPLVLKILHLFEFTYCRIVGYDKEKIEILNQFQAKKI
jgi:hypothetical protein